MPNVPISPVVRAILAEDIETSADDVIKKARNRGVTAPEKSIREAVYSLRSEMRKNKAKSAPAPAAARKTEAPKAAPAPASASRASSSSSDLTSVLSNVALVNTVVGVSGGVDQARQVAEAVRSCGGVEAFLQHLELVAQVRGGAA